jgi:starvation-inducible DNA-binding protein
MDTNDLYIEISRAIDKRLWFLEAHLQTATNTSRAATANTQSHAVKAGAKEAKALR